MVIVLSNFNYKNTIIIILCIVLFLNITNTLIISIVSNNITILLLLLLLLELLLLIFNWCNKIKKKGPYGVNEENRERALWAQTTSRKSMGLPITSNDKKENVCIHIHVIEEEQSMCV